jgi:hypothetical protein
MRSYFEQIRVNYKNWKSLLIFDLLGGGANYCSLNFRRMVLGISKVEGNGKIKCQLNKLLTLEELKRLDF